MHDGGREQRRRVGTEERRRVTGAQAALRPKTAGPGESGDVTSLVEGACLFFFPPLSISKYLTIYLPILCAYL